MAREFDLGEKVIVSRVFEFPPKTEWEALDEVRLEPVAVGHDRPAVVIGMSRRKVRAVVQMGYDFNQAEHHYLDWQLDKQTFYVVRFHLGGRRYYTTPEYMQKVTT